MSAIATSQQRPRRLRRLVSAGGVLAVLTIGALALDTGAASANTVYNNGSESTAYAGSSLSTHRIDVEVYAKQMPQYTNGQTVTTQVATQDVTYGAGQWRYFGWRTPSAINGYTTTLICPGAGCESTSLLKPVRLSPFVLWGTAGHSYNVWIGIGYWTGSAYTITWVLADCTYSWTSGGQTMSAHGNACHT